MEGAGLTERIRPRPPQGFARRYERTHETADVDGLVHDHLHAMEIAAEESDFVGRIKVGDIQEFAVADDARVGWRQGELRQRANLDCLSEREINRYRVAFRNLYSIDKAPSDRRSYNNQALVHQNHCQHGWERFLPWHRAYLYEFEQNLLDVFPTSPALPYWDWTMPYYWNDGEPAAGPVIPNAFKAYLDRQAFEVLVTRIELSAKSPSSPCV